MNWKYQAPASIKFYDAQKTRCIIIVQTFHIHSSQFLSVFGQYLHLTFWEESDLEPYGGMTGVVSTQAPALIFGHVPTPQKNHVHRTCLFFKFSVLQHVKIYSDVFAKH